WSLTLCNLGVRREAFTNHGLSFPLGCASAEENLLLRRIEQKLGPVLFSGDLAVLHERRDQWGSFCRQVFQSGRGRVQIARAERSTFSPLALAPLCVAASVAALPFAARRCWAAAPFALYAASCLAETLRLAVLERDPLAALRLPWLFLVGHLAYAAGLASGVG